MSALSPEQFLEALVRAYSPSGEERPAAECAAAQMEALGFRDVVIDEAGNVCGRWGQAEGKKVYLIGHIDTVPGEIPVRIEEQGGERVLYGRGSVDAKGPFAAFVSGVSELPKDVPLQILVAGAVEEEAASSKGARALAKSEPKPGCVIIGEPSGTNGITLGYKGRLAFRVEVIRSNSHSAGNAQSAGDILCRLVERVEEYRSGANGDLEGAFQPLDGTVQEIGVQSDGFEERGTLSYGLRLGPSFKPEEVEGALSALIEKFRDELVSTEESLKDLSCTFFQSEIPALFSKRSSLAAAFRKALRKNEIEPRHVTKTGTADMNVLAAEWDCEMAAYGPGDSALDHTPNEHLLLSDYSASIRVVRDTLLGIASR